VPSIKGLLISPPGFKAALVDISASGLLAEWGVPLKIGQAVTVALEGTFTPQSVPAHVIRSSIVSMTSASLRYHVGLAFTAPIVLEDQAAAATDAAETPAPDAVRDPGPRGDVVNRW
jgi:PilZ domain-containing protein